MANLEWGDLAGVLSVAAYLAGIGAVTMLNWRLARREGRGRALVVALVMVAGLYIGAVLTEAPSVMTVLRNGVADIPPSSAIRTWFFAAWVWLEYATLFNLYWRPAHAR